MDGLAFDEEDVARFRPSAETALRLLLVVIREERAGVVCMALCSFRQLQGLNVQRNVDVA